MLCTPLLIVVLHWLGHDVKLWGCPLKALIGIPCPTWGMTRAVFAISNRQWTAALHYHHLAPLVVLLWTVVLGQLSLELVTKRSWSRWWQRRSLWLGSILIMFGYHGGRLYQLWTSGALATSMQQSWLSHLL